MFLALTLALLVFAVVSVFASNESDNAFSYYKLEAYINWYTTLPEDTVEKDAIIKFVDWRNTAIEEERACVEYRWAADPNNAPQVKRNCGECFTLQAPCLRFMQQ